MGVDDRTPFEAAQDEYFSETVDEMIERLHVSDATAFVYGGVAVQKPDTGEVRAQHDGGAMKGRKPERMSLLPMAVLMDDARLMAAGADKYEAHNWRKGMPFSWALDACLRHIGAFMEGEDLDAETGESHLASARFHLASIRQYQLDGRSDLDDRYKPDNGGS